MITKTNTTVRTVLQFATFAAFAVGLLAGAHDSQAKDMTFTFQIDYTCGMNLKTGCDSVTPQFTQTSFTADDQQVTDLTAQSGGSGKGILTPFSIGTVSLDSAFTTLACADGTPLRFDPTAVFLNAGGKTYRDGFSCPKVTIQNKLVKLDISGFSASGSLRANISGLATKYFVNGKIRVTTNRSHTTQFVASSNNPLTHNIYIQNKWDSCTFAGFDAMGTVSSKEHDGCVLSYGPTTDSTALWKLETKREPAGAGISCYAICSVH